MEKPKAIISIGISGSGKSTELNKKEYGGYVRIERDFWRKRILESRHQWKDDYDENFWSIWKFTKENEKEVTAACNQILEDCIRGKLNVIISDTNLHAGRRNELVKRLQDAGYDVQLMMFPIDVMTAIKRDEQRRDTVGHQVIWKQYEQFCEQFPRKQYVPDVTKPKCILVDIDGTLAHMNGKRGAFEWDKVGVDDCDEMVKMVVNAVSDWADVKMIVLSGRDGVCRPETEKWLKDNTIVYDELIMREAGDQRKDTIVKEEIFWRDIADSYDVQFVIDDRPSVVRLWQSIGVKTFAVGNQHIEF